MKSKQIINIMKLISWIIFIGLCIKSGAILISAFVSLFINEVASSNLYLGLDFSRLYEFNKTYYILGVGFLGLVSILKAYIFYLVITLFTSINTAKPFSQDVVKVILRISYVAFFTGIIALIGNTFNVWLLQHVFFTPLHLGASEFLFMSGIIFIIAFLFKNAVAIQQENDLTI